MLHLSTSDRDCTGKLCIKRDGDEVVAGEHRLNGEKIGLSKAERGEGNEGEDRKRGGEESM